MSSPMATESRTESIRSYADIPGWFPWLDRATFTAVLEAQGQLSGDLVELGVYLGKSAVVIGDHLRPGERFVVVDLFGDADLLGAGHNAAGNRREVTVSYRDLTRTRFEQYYRALHDGELPEVVQGLSSSIVDHIAPATARFVHVDASHVYDQVRIDVRNARTILRPGGVVVFDDYRSGHTPGVAAAVWDAVLHGGLIPFAITPQKLYGVYDDPTPYLDAIRGLSDGDRRLSVAHSEVAGHDILRVNYAKAHLEAQQAERDRAAKSARAAEQAAACSARPVPTSQLSRSRRIVRRVARDVAPKSVSRWVVRQRDRRR